VGPFSWYAVCDPGRPLADAPPINIFPDAGTIAYFESGYAPGMTISAKEYSGQNAQGYRRAEYTHGTDKAVGHLGGSAGILSFPAFA